MAAKIRIGLMGANVRNSWASKSHIPALLASPDWELTAVCTTNPASAEEARKAYGARFAFADYREMLACPEIDAVAVVVRVHRHHETTKAAIEAGKHIYTEWPLGRTTEEAEELAALAKAKGIKTAIGLQARVSPDFLYLKELLQSGYVGEILSIYLTLIRQGALERPSTRNWQRDVNTGGNPLTINAAHVIDAMRFVAGDIVKLGGILTTQSKQWYETDTRKMVEVTSPDNVLLNAQLAGGAIASVHVGTAPWAPAGYRMDIYGKEGTIMVTGKVTAQRGAKLQGAQRGNELQDLPVPKQYRFVTDDFPKGDPYNIGQMYALFAQKIRTGSSAVHLPDFETALDMHHLLDKIRQVSEAGGTFRDIA